jgi:hypothetical protein
MIRNRTGLVVALGLASAAFTPALSQSVIATHSGVVYFFDGAVYIGDQQLVQKFGRFPDIGEGRELRTGQGRAEVLLTPGVVLRIGENSGVRMVSSKFSDTRVELLGGSAILEANEPAALTAVRLIHKSWQVRIPLEGVCRIDSQPPQVSVFKGEAEVSFDGGTEATFVRGGQTVPLAPVLVPEQAPYGAGDEFKNWAMGRSQAISSDNATAAEITDDPGVIENTAGTIGGLSYFPLTGIPGVAITNPYGLSFWSPFQSTLSSMYFPPYSYTSLYPGGWPTIIRHHSWTLPVTLNRLGVGGGLHPGGIASPGSLHLPPPTTTHPVTPRVGPHPGARR